MVICFYVYLLSHCEVPYILGGAITYNCAARGRKKQNQNLIDGRVWQPPHRHQHSDQSHVEGGFPRSAFVSQRVSAAQ
jgi:hypothetical protein